MKSAPFLVMASLFSFLFGGCSSPTDKVLYEGVYNGESYVVKSHETRTFNGNRTDWRVGLGALPELPINIRVRLGPPIPLQDDVTTDWAPPYSDEIFGKYERTYLGAAPVYSNKGDDYSNENKPQHDETMLYVSELVPQNQYRQYTAMMKAEWAKVNTALASDANSNFPRIIGIVHGSRRLFTRSFRGKCNGIAHVLRIDPDGYVNFGLDDGSAESNSMRHCKVQMPQKAIVLSQIYGWKDYRTSKAEIAQFKDSEGKNPAAYFKLRD